MRSHARFSVVALWLTVALCAAAPSRTAVKEAPVIFGREIPRFVLLQPIRINRSAPGLTNADLMDRLIGQMLPGQFVPVSEDAKGVYYQAARGFQREGHTSSVPAGLYVSKTRADTIQAYTGDARDLGAPLTIDVQRLTQSDLSKLKIGAVSGKAPR